MNTEITIGYLTFAYAYRLFYMELNLHVPLNKSVIDS